MTGVTRGESLAEHQNIGTNEVGNKAVARAPETRGNLVEYERHAVLVAQLAGTPQKLRAVHPHAARAL